jgi:hypothetical protein
MMIQDLINNMECTYVYEIDMLNELYFELVEEITDLEEDLKDLLDNDMEMIDPYNFQNEFIRIKYELADKQEQRDDVLERILKLKYETLN